MGKQYTRNIIISIFFLCVLIVLSNNVSAGATCEESGFNVCGTNINCTAIKAGSYYSDWEQYCDDRCGEDCPSRDGTNEFGCLVYTTPLPNGRPEPIPTHYCPKYYNCMICEPGYVKSGNSCKLECPTATEGTVNLGCLTPSPSIANSYNNASYHCTNPIRTCGFCNPGYMKSGSACVPVGTYFRDADNDSFGNASLSRAGPAAGYVSNSYDCNDANAAVTTTASSTPKSCTASNGCAGTNMSTCSNGVWTPGSCNAPTYNCGSYCSATPCCSISTASVTASSCPNGCCRTGDTLTVSVSFSGNCTAARSSPLNLYDYDGDCTISMNTGFSNIGNSPFIYTHTLSNFSTICDGLTLTYTDAALRTSSFAALDTYSGTADICLDTCGNGIKDGNDACDDGNKNNTDACSNSCTLTAAPTSCGDGSVQKPNSNGFNETCDGGSIPCPSGYSGNQACKADCSGYDNSNCTLISVGCNAGCALNTQCPTNFCSWPDFKCRNSSCSSQTDCSCYCGDGNIDAELGETCDAGAGNGACPNSCSSSCTINSCPSVNTLSITPQSGCDGMRCTNGSVLAVSLTYTLGSSAPTPKLAQIDLHSSDGSCIIQYNGVHMAGITYYSATGIASPLAFTYTIPQIPANCIGKNMTTAYVALYADQTMTTPVSSVKSFTIPAITLVNNLIFGTPMRCGNVSTTSRGMVPACTPPVPIPSMICPINNSCVYGTATLPASCHAYGSTILNTGGKNIVCSQSNTWCPKNYYYNGALCVPESSSCIAGCPQAANIPTTCKDISNCYWNNNACFKYNGTLKYQGCTAVDNWPDSIFGFDDIDVVGGGPPPNPVPNGTIDKTLGNLLRVECILNMNITYKFEAKATGGKVPYLYAWNNGTHTTNYSNISMYYNMYSTNSLLKVYVKDALNNTAYANCSR